jgi:hypothetical protein
MSAAAQTKTKIFGLRIGVDPKLIVIGLLAMAGVIFWRNFRGGEEEGAPPGRTDAPAAVAVRTGTEPSARRVLADSKSRGVLAIRRIDPTRGDIDPTLRLDLLARLQKIEPGSSGRNVFELGPAPQVMAAMAQGIRGPVVQPRPIVAIHPAGPVAPAQPVVNIPLKYYGFVKPADRTSPNRGFFLDGDNVLVAAEGDLLDHQYLVVELTPNSARMEDTRLKKGQVLSIAPEAVLPQ